MLVCLRILASAPQGWPNLISLRPPPGYCIYILSSYCSLTLWCVDDGRGGCGGDDKFGVVVVVLLGVLVVVFLVVVVEGNGSVVIRGCKGYSVVKNDN